MQIINNIDIAWPFLLLLLPVPYIYRWLVEPIRYGSNVIWLPLIADFRNAGQEANTEWRHWPWLLATLVWIFLLLAASRPLLVIEQTGLPTSGRDLMLAVDLSESMRQTDFEIDGEIIDRLEASKRVAGDFIAGREGDRIGLIVFGTQAYLQTPLTLDRKTVQILLDETSIGLAGSKTAIGDAIGLAVKRLKDTEAEQRVLIFMTDGANTAGKVSPLIAARLAADNDLRIYTIGIGKQEDTVASRRFLFERNAYGLDEQTLQKIALTTGGKYYRASDTEILQNIYDEIDKLEPVMNVGEKRYRYIELYCWPLAIALIILLLSQGYHHTLHIKHA